ncbi:CBU_0592 family membrane protein [Namhaeicola litoreus]|uniref:CBU-0592-like domain-containing protein n=1 Tax=Namhaeicola litoreus TaxID=1052145 RepID=A0ABW3XXN3_9FLAO
MTNTDWIGFIGVFQILLAYFLNVTGKVTHKDLSFILLNTIGAGMACLASILIHYVPFIILEGAWTLVSLISLLKFLSGSKHYQ